MKRYKELDVIRGILTLFVVFGHSIISDIRIDNKFYYYVWSFIYNFHMGAFFILSGVIYYINKNKYINKRKFLINKFRKLIIPYFIISIGIYVPISIYKIFINKENFIKTIINEFVSILTFQGNKVTHLWFIYSLFIIFSIVIILEEKIGYKRILFISLILNIIISFSTIKIIIIAKVMYYLFYFLIGKIVYTSLNKINKTQLLASYIIFIISQIVLIIVDSSKTTSITYLFHISCKISIIYVLYSLAQKILENDFLNNKFSVISKSSYAIYLFHQPFFTMGIGYITYNILNVNSNISVILATIIGITIPIIVQKNLYKYKINI